MSPTSNKAWDFSGKIAIALLDDCSCESEYLHHPRAGNEKGRLGQPFPLAGSLGAQAQVQHLAAQLKLAREPGFERIEKLVMG